MTRYLALIDQHQQGWHREPHPECLLCEQPEDGPADTPEQKLWERDPDDLRPPA